MRNKQMKINICKMLSFFNISRAHIWTMTHFLGFANARLPLIRYPVFREKNDVSSPYISFYLMTDVKWSLTRLVSQATRFFIQKLVQAIKKNTKALHLCFLWEGFIGHRWTPITADSPDTWPVRRKVFPLHHGHFVWCVAWLSPKIPNPYQLV